MPLSLKDRLKAVDRPEKPRDAGKTAPAFSCYHEEALFPFRDLAGVPSNQLVSGHALRLMLGCEAPENIDFRKILYLDTETTGLSGGAGTIAFLVGAGYFTEEGFLVHQWLMRDYPEERFMLTALLAMLDGFDMVVTFNGKTFDLPLLQSRLLMNRMGTGALDRVFHADLLHPARRVWKLRLKSCRLARLEEEIFHQPREDDLPGSEAPERFFRYLKTGDFSLLTDVLRHNRQDIVSLAKLMDRLLDTFEKPEQQSFFEDIFSVGRALERQGETELARRCYHLVTEGGVREQARLKLGKSFVRCRELDSAIEVYRHMIVCREGGLTPYVELAKLYEHRQKDIKNALEITEMAIFVASEPSLRTQNAMQEDQNALQYRYMRLLKKAQAVNRFKEARRK